MKKKKTKLWMPEASLTIEAAVIIPITLVIVASVLFFSFYLHDLVTIKSSGTVFLLECAENYKDRQKDEGGGGDHARTVSLLSADDGTLGLGEDKNGLSVTCMASHHFPGAMVRSILGDSTGQTKEVIVMTHIDARKEILKYKAVADGAELLGEE